MASAVSARITDVRGVTVGHWTDVPRATGCTVVLAPEAGVRAACAIRGRATGTRELDALDPHHLVDRVDAILLTGGSAYGLGAADGVMRWLRERGRGLPVGPAGMVPIVPTSVIFDFDLAPGGPAGAYVDALSHLAGGGRPFGAREAGTPTAAAGLNTTLAVVATNATLDRTALQGLAQAAGDALARRIVPYGTLFDGDVVFAISTAASVPATPLQAEALAALAVPIAVERAVRLARGVRDIPGLADGRAT